MSTRSMSPTEKRQYWREIKRRARERRWAAAAMAADDATCGHRRGRGICGGRLTSRLVHGVTVPHCARCARHAAGCCVECGTPIPRSDRPRWYCELHRLLSDRKVKREWNRAHSAELAARRREQYARLTPAEKAAYHARRKLYAIAASPTHPARAIARAQLTNSLPTRAAS